MRENSRRSEKIAKLRQVLALVLAFTVSTLTGCLDELLGSSSGGGSPTSSLVGSVVGTAVNAASSLGSSPSYSTPSYSTPSYGTPTYSPGYTPAPSYSPASVYVPGAPSSGAYAPDGTLSADIAANDANASLLPAGTGTPGIEIAGVAPESVIDPVPAGSSSGFGPTEPIIGEPPAGTLDAGSTGSMVPVDRGLDDSVVSNTYTGSIGSTLEGSELGGGMPSMGMGGVC